MKFDEKVLGIFEFRAIYVSIMRNTYD